MLYQDPDNALQRQRIHEIEKLRHRSEWLNSKDKAMMQMIFEKGSTFDQIARLTGQSPSTVNRRFHGLLQKLTAKEFTALLRGRHKVDSTDIRIVRDYYIQGLPQQAIARKLSISLYRIRKILRLVRSITYNSDNSPDPYDEAGRDQCNTSKRNRKQSHTEGALRCTH